MVPPYYDSLFQWMLAIARDLGRPCILGVNGPQGCGKSTLVSHLVPRFAAAGLKAVALSIDDFYLTNAEQRALAVLGLGEDSDLKAVRASYSKLVRRFHPDRNGGDRSHEARLGEVIEAYQLLRKAVAFA